MANRPLFGFRLAPFKQAVHALTLRGVSSERAELFNLDVYK